jgi:DNA-binding CsgD family transcriptional regulator
VDNFSGVFSPELSESVLWERMLAVFADRLRVTSALYGFVPSVYWLKEGTVSRALTFRHNHPPDIMGDAEPGALLERDATTLRLSAGEPWFFWRDATAWPGVTAAQLAYQESGVKEGNVGVSIAMPFFEGRALAGLGLCARTSTPEEFEKRWHDGLDDHLALARAFDAAMRPRMIANRFKLSHREVSVVRLLANGLTAKQVASQLGLQPKTVFNVMDKARKSLHSETTLEAVTKALAYQII